MFAQYSEKYIWLCSFEKKKDCEAMLETQDTY